MQIDLETLRWLLTGFFVFSGSLISYLLKREIGFLSDAIKQSQQDIKDALRQIAEMKLDIAAKYVSKIDLEKQLDTHLAPIRDDMRDIKGDVKALLQRP